MFREFRFTISYIACESIVFSVMFSSKFWIEDSRDDVAEIPQPGLSPGRVLPEVDVKLIRLLLLCGIVSAVGGGIAVSSPAHHIVSQKAKAFDRKEVVVSVGDRVSFQNNDRIKHNILIAELGYNGGIQQPGGESVVVFDSNGTFKVRCGIHSRMKMTVVVE